MSFLGSFKSLFGSGTQKKSKNTRVNVRQRFELLREAISGTMSSFYMARDRETGNVVGLKILDMDKLSAVESRFKALKKPSEGEISTAMVHPRIVKTYDYGVTTSDQQFIVMEFLEGAGLNSITLSRSPLIEGKRVLLIRQAAEALAYVHASGYIHRDICPRNFVVAKDFNSLKMIDFGLTLPARPEFMQPGNRTGTPNYMAPEIVRRRKTDHRLDIFAFGVMAYEVCSFELPWPRGKTGRAAMEHDTEPVDIREHRPKIHPKLAEAIMKCLAADPEQRPKSMEDFLRMFWKIDSEDVN